MPKLGRPFALTREQIGDAVVELGLDTFSVRALAAHLGVTEKTLYNNAAGRNGLLALGMEQAMRASPDAPRAFWTDAMGWREILEGVVEEAWRFMNAVPGVGALIAQGVHSRAEAEYSAAAGEALMVRGLSAKQAIEALALVFELVAMAFVGGQRMDVPRPGESGAERDRVVAELAPAATMTAPQRELFEAVVESMWEPTKAVLDRRIAIVLDGLAEGFRRA